MSVKSKSSKGQRKFIISTTTRDVVVQVMAAFAVWKILEEIILEFRRKRLTVPQKVMDNFKAAKSLINIEDVNSRNCAGMTEKIGELLCSVEAYLISEAQEVFSAEIIEKWLKQIEKASQIAEAEEKSQSRYIIGLNKKQKWIRIEPLIDLDKSTLENIATELSLSFRIENNGQFLIYGDNELIKKFIKNMIMMQKEKAKRNSR